MEKLFEGKPNESAEDLTARRALYDLNKLVQKSETQSQVKEIEREMNKIVKVIKKLKRTGRVLTKSNAKKLSFGKMIRVMRLLMRLRLLDVRRHIIISTPYPQFAKGGVVNKKAGVKRTDW